MFAKPNGSIVVVMLFRMWAAVCHKQIRQKREMLMLCCLWHTDLTLILLFSLTLHTTNPNPSCLSTIKEFAFIQTITYPLNSRLLSIKTKQSGRAEAGHSRWELGLVQLISSLLFINLTAEVVYCRVFMICTVECWRGNVLYCTFICYLQ